MGWAAALRAYVHSSVADWPLSFLSASFSCSSGVCNCLVYTSPFVWNQFIPLWFVSICSQVRLSWKLRINVAFPPVQLCLCVSVSGQERQRKGNEQPYQWREDWAMGSCGGDSRWPLFSRLLLVLPSAEGGTFFCYTLIWTSTIFIVLSVGAVTDSVHSARLTSFFSVILLYHCEPVRDHLLFHIFILTIQLATNF